MSVGIMQHYIDNVCEQYQNIATFAVRKNYSAFLNILPKILSKNF